MIIIDTRQDGYKEGYELEYVNGMCFTYNIPVYLCGSKIDVWDKKVNSAIKSKKWKEVFIIRYNYLPVNKIEIFMIINKNYNDFMKLYNRYNKLRGFI